MSISLDLTQVVYKAEFLLLERSVLEQSGPTLQIVHRFRARGFGCLPGEEVFQVFLLYRGRQILLALPLALRLLINYLAIHRYTAQSATQIAAGMRTHFYQKHGLNSGILSRRKISRTAVKEYVKRIREAFGAAFDEVGLTLRPATVLISLKTLGNEVLYSLRATVKWVHQDDLPSTSIRRDRSPRFTRPKRSELT